jgi:hypothetical protein
MRAQQLTRRRTLAMGARAAGSLGVGVGALLFSLVMPAVVHAEPYLVPRAGAKCSACHTNQTGGGKRTAFAYIHAHDILHDLDLLPIPEGVKAFNGELNTWVSVGGDLRVRNSTLFEDDPGPDGRVPENRAFRRDTISNDLSVFEFLGYAQVDLWPDVATVYVDYNLEGGATNREVFGMLRGFLPWDTYVKAGRMFPAFGLRVHDDEAFTRGRSGFTFQNPDEGAEVGIAPGPFFIASTITNGEGGDKDVQATINGYGVFEEVPVVRNVLAGLSFARQSDKRNVTAFYGGANLWRFTYLGEVDIISDSIPESPTRSDTFAAYAELNLLLLDWLNLRGTFDFAKISRDRDRTRYAIGAEPFINRVIQPRIQYRINNGPPDQPEINRAELVVEMHFFF